MCVKTVLRCWINFREVPASNDIRFLQMKLLFSSTNGWANFSEKIQTHCSGKILWGSTLILSQVQDSHLVLSQVVLSQVSLHFINRVLCNSFQDNFTKLHCKCKLAECSLPQYVLYAITTIYHTYSLFIERRVEQIINLSATSSVGQIHSAFNRPLKLSLPLWST